ncbi:MAG: hypothetical protein RSA24_00735 [Clostridia bacterium]
MSEMTELTKFNVVSSRVRLARNVEGMPFSSAVECDPNLLVKMINDVTAAANCVAPCDLYLMSRLSKQQKTALIERHIISLPLANNLETGAVVIERQQKSSSLPPANNLETGAVVIERGQESVSIMLNEEDRIREQCLVEGFSLGEAYKKLDRFDDSLLSHLQIAYDRQFGFLTACPTNVGTGMRASTMLFLPALKLAGAIEIALTEFISKYGLTVRGVYGEGSEALGDMYQLSNTRTLGVDEATIVKIIELATIELCASERRALIALKRESGNALLDRISRSFATLSSAYKMSYEEMMKLVSDAKLGVILDILPLKDIKKLNQLVWLCSASSIRLKNNDIAESDVDIARASIVRKILKEGN